jgi:hypothetical protein
MSILTARPVRAPLDAGPGPERSVVAWHGTRSSRAALAWAAAREQRRGGAVVLVRVLEDGGGFRLSSEVQRALGELDAELAALRKAFPDLDVSADLRAGSAEEVLPAVSTGAALLVVGTHTIDGAAVRSRWSLGLRLLAGGRASVAIVPTECWSWRTGVVAPFRGAIDGAAVLFAAEEAQARGMRLTLVADETVGAGADEERELVAAAFPGLEVGVVRAAAPAPVLVGLARSAALVVTGADDPADRRPFAAGLAAASEAPVAVIRAPRLRRQGGTSARAARSLF